MSEKQKTKLVVKKNITIDQILAARPNMIFYGAHTCWWTDDEKDLATTPTGLPVDPRGGVLFQTDDPQEFIKKATEHVNHYGKHGLEAFIAAHHKNSFESTGQKPWCSPNWSDYNDAIDESATEGKTLSER